MVWAKAWWRTRWVHDGVGSCDGGGKPTSKYSRLLPRSGLMKRSGWECDNVVTKRRKKKNLTFGLTHLSLSVFMAMK